MRFENPANGYVEEVTAGTGLFRTWQKCIVA
jgi:hypothetical protein